jgi:hypothetical protein
VRTKVDDRVDPGERLLDSVGILDRGVDEGEPRVGLDIAQALAATGVGQLVEHGDLVVAAREALPHKVRADETGTTADEQLHRGMLSRISAR